MKSVDPDRLITDIVTREDPAALSITVKGSQPLTYTAEKQNAPLGVLFHFPGTGLDHLKEVYYPPENEMISSIRASEFNEGGKTSRIFISLKGDLAYELSPEGTDLKIVFPKTGEPTAQVSQRPSIQESETDKAVAAPPPAGKSLVPATALLSVNTEPSKDTAVIHVEADGALQNYKSLTLAENPPRIVFDFPGIRSPYKSEQRMAFKTGPVSQVRHLAYPDKVRLVVETQRPYLGK